MSIATFWQVLVAVYRLTVVLWNASVVFAKVVRSAMEEAKQEAAELMASLEGSASTLNMITLSSLRDDTGPENPLQMLIIARASSFVLLVRLSKCRVLYLEVDEKFITGKLKVIRTELMLHIQHVPHLLHIPIGTHDTTLVRYTPMMLPYLWRETTQMGIERSAAPVSYVTKGKEGTHRKKYVQLLAESALRRQMQMGRLALEAAPKEDISVAKTQGEKAGKKRALANATNTTTVNRDEPTEETHGMEKSALPKMRMMERAMHRTRSENSHVNHAEQLRRVASQSLRRKRGQFDLYAQGVSSEFSLVPKS